MFWKDIIFYVGGLVALGTLIRYIVKVSRHISKLEEKIAILETKLEYELNHYKEKIDDHKKQITYIQKINMDIGIQFASLIGNKDKLKNLFQQKDESEDK